MDPEIAKKLLTLNRQFYQSFAPQFSATRKRIQPGVARILESIPIEASILDLGCGNGELARELAERGHRGPYVGLDFSMDMLKIAQRETPADLLEATFYPADLSKKTWNHVLSGSLFDYILAFAVLHHLPGEDIRRQLVKTIHGHLSPDGRFIHSNWQFLNSERLRDRIQPWERVEMRTADVEPDDYLLDWRHGGYGLRYVHHFSQKALKTLAKKTGFRVLDSFLSDGEGGKLGLYQIWEAKS